MYIGQYVEGVNIGSKYTYTIERVRERETERKTESKVRWKEDDISRTEGIYRT